MSFIWDVLAVIGAFTVLVTGLAFGYHYLNRRQGWHR